MSEAINKKETIAVLLKDELSYIYCDSCEHEMYESACDYCHRKNMCWSLSMNTALEIAEKVLKIAEGENEC